MEKILTQEQIDALFRATQKGQIPADGVKAKPKNISNFDIRTAGQVDKNQVRPLSAILEIFAPIRLGLAVTAELVGSLRTPQEAAPPAVLKCL